LVLQSILAALAENMEVKTTTVWEKGEMLKVKEKQTSA
jgi:hypothetical protein